VNTVRPPFSLGRILGAIWALGLSGMACAQDAADLTPEELLNAARIAYDASDWPKAESLFDSFIQSYETVPELVETARRARPLLVTARLRLKKYSEALPLLETVLKDVQLDAAAADELAFWRGICHLQVQAYDPAMAAFGEFYAEKMPYLAKLPDANRRTHAGRRVEALLLHGVCQLLKEDYVGTAKFFGDQIPSLRQTNREAAGRATVLRLHALLKAGDDSGALVLVRETYPRMSEITQVVAFQTLTLELGSKLLEAGRFYDAILCLQRIWPKARLLGHQKLAQQRFIAQLALVKKSPGQEYLAFQYEGLLARIQREVENFEKIENFDSALRLRVAMAYKELKRYREAALVLEDMLARLPPDPVVEKAALSLIQCWMQVERWPRAVEAADSYLEKFTQKDNADVPMVKFLKASALHADRKSNEAELAFATVHQLHADHELAPRALFMEGICLLEQDLNREAMDAFAEAVKRYPESDVQEDCHYWTGMALSFEKDHVEAIEQMEAHLKRFSESGRYKSEATFRIAFSHFGLADYATAIPQLRSYIQEHPGSSLAEEAKLLLGDALGAEGKIEEAIAAFRSVDREASARFFEEAVFRIGNIYKLAERPSDMRTHYEQFIRENPDSQRIAEAVYWVGVTHSNEGRIEEARKAYWDAIQAHGDKATSRGVEDVMSALPKVYAGAEGKADLIRKMEKLSAEAREDQPTLSLRLRWARAMLTEKTDHSASQPQLIEAALLLQPKIHSPRIIADCADALRQIGKRDEARALYTELRKWHPRAMEKDRAFLGLGLIALEKKKPDEALKFLARFEQETLGSPLIGEVARIKGDLLAEDRRYAEAQAEYERILDMPTVPRQLKAQILLKLGDMMVVQKQSLKGTAYYERVYVSFGKYHPEVAQAYWKRAEVLDSLNQKDKAQEVYRELAERQELSSRPEAQKALRLLNARDPEWRTRERVTETTPEAPAL
jgi:TolA-binding protein